MICLDFWDFRNYQLYYTSTEKVLLFIGANFVINQFYEPFKS